MRTALALEVAAAPRQIFDLARDVSRWPELLPHYRRVTVRSRHRGRIVAQMVAVRQLGPLPVPVTWRAMQWADETDEADLQLHFRHVRGLTRGMSVTWHIRPTATGSRVTIEHVFSRRLPLVGSEALPALLDRFFVRPIATRTLARFRCLAERAD